LCAKDLFGPYKKAPGQFLGASFILAFDLFAKRSDWLPPSVFYILFYRRPVSVDIVVIFQRLEELTHFCPLGFGKLRKLLGQITSLAGDDDQPSFAKAWGTA